MLCSCGVLSCCVGFLSDESTRSCAKVKGTPSNLIHSPNSIMAALPAVPLGQPQHLSPGLVRVRVRALNPGRNTFWMRQAFVDNPPAGYVSVDDIMEAQPHLQDLLNTQLPFMAKVVMRVQLSEESFDPIDGEREVIFSERRFATVPMLVRPLADPAERLRRYVVAGSRRTLEDRLEHARFNNSQQKLEGIVDLQIFTSPSMELAQLPAAPGGAFEGGCWKELPELLKRGNKGLWSPKNGDHKCFRYCVMAHLLGCATWGRKYRQDAAECRGRPFYALPPCRPSKAQRALPPVDLQSGWARDRLQHAPGRLSCYLWRHRQVRGGQQWVAGDLCVPVVYHPLG